MQEMNLEMHLVIGAMNRFIDYIPIDHFLVFLDKFDIINAIFNTT